MATTLNTVDETAMTDFLSKEHRILEKGMMEFQPFGRRPDGTYIRDISGLVTSSTVKHLENVVSRRGGTEAGRQAVEELVRRDNERIADPAYRVTIEFLKNPWNCYSNEFAAFNGEFCVDISGDPLFNLSMAREQAISPIIQVLGRAFSVQQIYQMSLYFSQRYSRNSFYTEAVDVGKRSARIRMSLDENTLRQFGVYRRACGKIWCDSHKGYFIAVPEQFHNLPPATVEDRCCIAEGDECCEWDVTWQLLARRWWSVPMRVNRSVSAEPKTETSDSRHKPKFPHVKDASSVATPEAASPAEAQREWSSSSLPVDTISEPSSAAPPSSPVAAPEGAHTFTLLSKEHVITEKGLMEFQPFGVGSDGKAIRDLSGLTIRACIDYLEDHVSRTKGHTAGKQAVEELARRLNERIPDRAYHVTSAFLRNSWNSYSYEFTAFLSQFCLELSGDPLFSFNMARQKAISPFVQVLGRPLSVARIYRMSSQFAHMYSGKSAYSIEVVKVSNHTATIRMRFGPRAHQQFGRYIKGCAQQWCEAHKGYLVAVPEKFHQLPPAVITDKSCIARGDPVCEWDVSWSARDRPLRQWPVITSLARRVLRQQIEERERLIEEQVRTLDMRHVELQEAYVLQQQITAELQRRVEHLTILRDAGLVLGSILDRETLIEQVLTTIVDKLHYDRAMVRFFDQDRNLAHDARIIGVPEDVAARARTEELTITDEDSIEGRVLLRGEPVLIADVQQVLDHLHPANRQLAALMGAKSLISVPLKVKNRILGSVTVDRIRQRMLTEDDLGLMVTFASQVAIALDNTYAYREIEELNLGLEEKVRARTAALEQFLARVSHDLRTPLTSICGFADNMLDGLAGALTEKQSQYLTRMLSNGRRLGRLVDNLLDMLVDPDKTRLSLAEVDLCSLVADVVEQLRPLATSKRQCLELSGSMRKCLVWADSDKMTRVLINLVDNAIKYTPPQGSILVQTEVKDRFALVSVIDTGEGIPSDALARIFDPAFTINRENKVQVTSHRLGLSIVKDLVERHGGAITVDSGIGQGTTFTFTVPLVRLVQKSDQATDGQLGKRLLIADDDPDIRQMLSDRLRSEGYIVTVASDGPEALSSLEHGEFDGLILDIGLPRLTGLEVLSRVHADRPALPIIMITAAASEERALLALQSGAHAYLLKPFDPGRLLELVGQHVGN